jgi:hypothetical protein
MLDERGAGGEHRSGPIQVSHPDLIHVINPPNLTLWGFSISCLPSIRWPRWLSYISLSLASGSVSSFKIALWLTILAAVAAVIGGGFTLNRYGRRSAAKLVLAILGVPALLYGLFIVLLVVMQPNWH